MEFSILIGATIEGNNMLPKGKNMLPKKNMLPMESILFPLIHVVSVLRRKFLYNETYSFF